MAKEQVTRTIPSNDTLIAEISRRQAKLLEGFLNEVECKRRFNLRFLQKVRGTKAVTERITFLQPATTTERDPMRIQIQTSPDECLEYSIVEVKGEHRGSALYTFFIQANFGLNVWPAPKPAEKDKATRVPEKVHHDGHQVSRTKFRKAILNGNDEARRCIEAIRLQHGDRGVPVTVETFRVASEEVLGVHMKNDADYEYIIALLAEPSRGMLTRANGLFYIAGEAPFETVDEPEEVVAATEEIPARAPENNNQPEEPTTMGDAHEDDAEIDPVDALLRSLEGKKAKQQRRLDDLKVCECEHTLALKTRAELEEKLARLQERLKENDELLTQINERKARLEEEGKEFEADKQKMARLKALLAEVA